MPAELWALTDPANGAVIDVDDDQLALPTVTYVRDVTDRIVARTATGEGTVRYACSGAGDGYVNLFRPRRACLFWPHKNRRHPIPSTGRTEPGYKPPTPPFLRFSRSKNSGFAFQKHSVWGGYLVYKPR